MCLSKKSQTSFFMIVGLIMLLAVIAGVLVYNNIRAAKIKEEAKLAEINSQALEVEKFINDCIRKVNYEGLKRLGQTGGYFEVPDLINYNGLSLWYIEQANIQPFLNQTQERLLEYINKNVPKCIENENLSKYGFVIEQGNPFTSMEFGSNDITLKIKYSIKLTKEKFTKEFSDFFNTFDIRYRSIFEAATEVNERLFDADFDIKDPLKNLGYLKSLDFDVAYNIPKTDYITFTITDKKSITPTNEFYTFSFAAKLGLSELKKIIDMQERSASNPTFLPYTIYSVDKKAQLDISEGTTVSLRGRDVESIIVQQSYPKQVITKSVPVYKKNSEIIQRENIRYVVDNPVYSFEPTGIRFNKFEKLTIYYDDENKDYKGVGILMGKNGFWVPILSKHEPQYKRVYSNILGFTEFTALFCASQPIKRTIAEHYFEPSGLCFFSLALTLISLATVIYSIVGLGLFPFLPNYFNALVAALGTTLAVGIVTVQTASLITTIATLGSSYEQSPENCIAFYPVCEQTVTIRKEEKDGKGMCIPSGSVRVAAGQPMQVCAFVKKCNAISKFLCMPCSVKCTASFY